MSNSLDQKMEKTMSYTSYRKYIFWPSPRIDSYSKKWTAQKDFAQLIDKCHPEKIILVDYGAREEKTFQSRCIKNNAGNPIFCVFLYFLSILTRLIDSNARNCYRQSPYVLFCSSSSTSWFNSRSSENTEQ